MSARDVYDEIQRTTPLLLAYHKNAMATTNTILAQLPECGEATASPGDHGQCIWLWVAERDSRLRNIPDHNGAVSIA